MFDLFVQGDRSLERSSGGLGIGLTLVQKLTELHGGTVMATSEGPGKGSEFTVRLPAAKQRASELPKVRKPKPELDGETLRAASSSSTTTTDLARGMAKLLEIHGHTVADRLRRAIRVR